MAVAPPHTAAQGDRGSPAVRAHLPGARDIWHDLGAGVVPVEQLVVLCGAMAVRGVERSGEAAPPRAAVLADLAQRLDDERILPDALAHGRKLAGLHELGELRRLLERLWIPREIGDDLGALELADQVRAGLDALRLGPRHQTVRHLRGGEREEPGLQHPASRGLLVVVITHGRVLSGLRPIRRQLWRRMSCSGSGSGSGAARPAIRSSKVDAAARPSSWRGTRTVVSGGVTRLA